MFVIYGCSSCDLCFLIRTNTCVMKWSENVVRRDFPCILYLIWISYLAFKYSLWSCEAVIYIEFALSCFSSLKLYTFYFHVYFAINPGPETLIQNNLKRRNENLPPEYLGFAYKYSSYNIHPCWTTWHSSRVSQFCLCISSPCFKAKWTSEV